QVPAGSSVVVIGTGGVGLNAVQGARLSGANPIIAVDIADNKLAAAREFGATHTFNTNSSDVRAAVRELTHGRKADYVLVTVGNPAAVTQGLHLARRGGTVVIVGMPAAGATAPLPIGDMAWGGLIGIGRRVGQTGLRDDDRRHVVQ